MCVLRARGMGPAAGEHVHHQMGPVPQVQHERSNPCEKVLNVNNVGNLGLKWSYATGDRVHSSPAVANGVVYVGSDDHNVYALNASTGAKLWSYTTGDVVDSSPAVANGVVYVGSYDGNVYALNASTGAKLWSYTTGASVYSSPAVANGVVYVGSDDGNVYALNASTGAKLWSYTTGSGGVVPRPPWRMGWFMSARTTATCTR